jgi:hypothetical protein
METMNDEKKARLQETWCNVIYLIIDKYSMLSKMFLARLSRNIGIGSSLNRRESDHLFRGINVILCGDLHQFPPVALSIKEALFHEIEPFDSVESQLGRTIYKEFNTIVILKEQYRINDPVWKDFLQHLRNGNVQEHHIKMLKQQVIGNPGSLNVDFNTTPWNDASLVTPRHAIRTQWNAIASHKHCQKTNKRLYVCDAEDTFKGRPL